MLTHRKSKDLTSTHWHCIRIVWGMRCATLIVWNRNMGFGKLYHCDIFHRNFVRNLLKSFKFTPICMLYGESSSYNISAKMTHFWLNLILDLKIHLTWKIIWLILKAVINITSPNLGPLHITCHIETVVSWRFNRFNMSTLTSLTDAGAPSGL